MTLLLLLLTSSTFALDAEPEKLAPLRYVRASDGKFVTESEVTTTRGEDGTIFISRTERPDETMTLTLRFNKDGRLTSAEAVREAGDKKKSAQLTLKDKKAQLKMGGTTEFFDLDADPVVTTAPDWSDLFQMVRRFDAEKGGKQEFPGLWIHPERPMQTLTFTLERLDSEKVVVKEKEQKLERYRAKLRSGEYLVWTDASGRIVKVTPPDPKGKPVVLEGFEDLVRVP